MKKKIFIYVLIGILTFFTVIEIEVGIICAVKGVSFQSFIKDVWSWYKYLILV